MTHNVSPEGDGLEQRARELLADTTGLGMECMRPENDGDRVLQGSAIRAITAALQASPAVEGADLTPRVCRLVVAAREVAYDDDPGDTAIQELDAASEAFAADIVWDAEAAPIGRSGSDQREAMTKAAREAIGGNAGAHPWHVIDVTIDAILSLIALPSAVAEEREALKRMVAIDEEIEAKHPGWMTGGVE